MNNVLVPESDGRSQEKGPRGTIHTPTVSDAKRQLQDRVEQAGLHTADLERNRLGQLASGQPKYLWGGPAWRPGAIAPVVAIVGLAGGAFAFLRGQDVLAFFWGLVGVGVVFLLAAYWMDLHSSVSKADGMLTKEVSHHLKGGTSYSLIFVVLGATEARRLRFTLPRQVVELIPEGGPYRVYYTPRFKALVNLEPLPGWRKHGPQAD